MLSTCLLIISSDLAWAEQIVLIAILTSLSRCFYLSVINSHIRSTSVCYPTSDFSLTHADCTVGCVWKFY
jgi:hypothetical protein